MIFEPREDSDQPRHLPSMSFHCPHEETFGPQLPTEHTLKTDQTGQMPRLIQVFAGHTDHFVSFVMRQLKCFVHSARLTSARNTAQTNQSVFDGSSVSS